MIIKYNMCLPAQGETCTSLYNKKFAWFVFDSNLNRTIYDGDATRLLLRHGGADLILFTKEGIIIKDYGPNWCSLEKVWI
jgi:hypothetical protein